MSSLKFLSVISECNVLDFGSYTFINFNITIMFAHSSDYVAGPKGKSFFKKISEYVLFCIYMSTNYSKSYNRTKIY